MSLHRTTLLALAALVLLPLAATTAIAAPGGGCDQICIVGTACCCGGQFVTCVDEGESCSGVCGGGGPSVEEIEEETRFIETLALGGGCENTCDTGMACCCDGRFVGCSESCSGACAEGEELEIGFDAARTAASCSSAR